MLKLTGERAELVEFSDKHLHDPAYWGWLRDPEVVGSINRVEYLLPMHFSSVEAYVRNLWQSDHDAFFAIHARDTGSFVGTARLSEIDWRTGIANVGIMIGERSRWGQGLATDAVRVLGGYAFGQLGLRKLVGTTRRSNTGMCRCFAKLGFVEEGCMRANDRVGTAFEDRVLFGCFGQEFQGAP